mmetsp:Transcript_9056/g.25094  ORF Transcript_9056/g.25094 Transcript_9056/m.25094 type:complete len:147 (-) Transcript_9056:286-726(-)
MVVVVVVLVDCQCVWAAFCCLVSSCHEEKRRFAKNDVPGHKPNLQTETDHAQYIISDFGAKYNCHKTTSKNTWLAFCCVSPFWTDLLFVRGISQSLRETTPPAARSLAAVKFVQLIAAGNDTYNPTHQPRASSSEIVVGTSRFVRW